MSPDDQKHKITRLFKSCLGRTRHPSHAVIHTSPEPATDMRGSCAVEVGTQSPELCTRCSALDLLNPLNDFWRLKHVFEEDCRLCVLFEMIIRSYKVPLIEGHCIEGHYNLHGYPWNGFQAFKLGDAWMLTDRYKESATSSIQRPTRSPMQDVHPTRINWLKVRKWLGDCKKWHDRCSVDIEVDLPGFVVIDCSSRMVIPVPQNCEYAALSYVWGSSVSSYQTVDRVLPKVLPRVIQDAITCALALDINYLWIDRYCIDQNDTDVKSRMIANMDRIYRCATITFIDAASEDPTAGLVGVSGRSRQGHNFVNLSGTSIHLLPNVQSDIAQSRWGSRGWTYQEGLLSRRRLVFTHTQLYFQCCSGYHSDLLASAGEAHPLPFQNKWKNLGDRDFQVFPVMHHSPEPQDSPHIVQLTPLIQNYTEKDLRYLSDTLNAFMGILGYFWTYASPIYHFWGVPFRIDHSLVIASEQEKRFLDALLWNPCEPFSEMAESEVHWKDIGGYTYDGNDALLESHGLTSQPQPTNITRRDMFPSWSWTGWTNLAQFQLGGTRLGKVVTHASIEIEKLNHERCSVSGYIDAMNLDFDHSKFLPRLHFNGWMTNLYFLPSENGFNQDAPGQVLYGHWLHKVNGIADSGVLFEYICSSMMMPHSSASGLVHNGSRSTRSYSIMCLWVNDAYFVALALHRELNGSYIRVGWLKWEVAAILEHSKSVLRILCRSSRPIALSFAKETVTVV